MSTSTTTTNKSKVISTTTTTSSSTIMAKNKLQEIVSNNSNNIEHEHEQAELQPSLFQSSSNTSICSETLQTPLSPIPSSFSLTPNLCIKNTNNLPLINANQQPIKSTDNLQSFENDENSHESIRKTQIQLTDVEDLNGKQTSLEYSTNNLEEKNTTAITAEEDINHGEAEYAAIRQKKLSLTLPLLNVVITDMTSSTSKPITPPPSAHQQEGTSTSTSTALVASINSKTKKFYESDDAFIQTIFSQTITSTTATPTDDYATYPFDEFNALTPIVAGIGVDSTNLLPINQQQQQPDSLNDDTQTEKLDMYIETLISFSDIVGMDNACKNGVSTADDDSEFEYNKIYDNISTDSQYAMDDAKTDNSCSLYDNLPDASNNNFDGSPIVADNENMCLNDDQTQNQPFSSYFDQTIEEDHINDEMEKVTSPTPLPNNLELVGVNLISNNTINHNSNPIKITKNQSNSSSSSSNDEDDEDDEENDLEKDPVANSTVADYTNIDQQMDLLPYLHNIDVHVSCILVKKKFTS